MFIIQTCCRPTQSPDGDFLSNVVPPAQILREMQPTAKLIVVLTDPVKRMYSDYYFLGDDLLPILRPNAPKPNPKSKSAKEFHFRVEAQIELFNICIDTYLDILQSQVPEQNHSYPKNADVLKTLLPKKYISSYPLWFRAAQM